MAKDISTFARANLAAGWNPMAGVSTTPTGTPTGGSPFDNWKTYYPLLGQHGKGPGTPGTPGAGVPPAPPGSANPYGTA